MIKVAYTNHIGHGAHDDSAKSTNISCSADLSGVEKHNNHDYTQEDVDRMQSSINLELKPYNKQFDRNLLEVDHLNLVRAVKQIYHEKFDAAVDEYNQKQKRKDRKIEDYFEKVSEDKKTDLAVEGIIQIGSACDWEDKSLEEKQKTLPIYLDILKEMLREIPGLKLAGASFHINESSPHLHWVGVCVDPNEHNRGLRFRVSKSAVLTQDVLGDVLQTSMRERMESQVKEIFGWEFEDKKSGRNKDLSINQYKNLLLQQENERLEQINKELIENIPGKIEELERTVKLAVEPLEELEEDILPDLDKRKFIDYCLDQFKGVLEPIYGYCSRFYTKWKNDRQKIAENASDKKVALDANIDRIKSQTKEIKKNSGYQKPKLERER